MAAAEGEEESLAALRTFAPGMAHETEHGKMTYCREIPAQMDVPALVMAIEPGRKTYFHVAWAQVDDPACTMEMAHGMEPGTYYRVKPSQNDPALAEGMAPAMEPGKMTYCRVRPAQMDDPALVMVMEPGKMGYARLAPSQMNDLALVMAMEPGKMTYYHVASLQVDARPYTLEMAHAMVPDRMTYSRGEW